VREGRQTRHQSLAANNPKHDETAEGVKRT